MNIFYQRLDNGTSFTYRIARRKVYWIMGILFALYVISFFVFSPDAGQTISGFVGWVILLFLIIYTISLLPFTIAASKARRQGKEIKIKKVGGFEEYSWDK